MKIFFTLLVTLLLIPSSIQGFSKKQKSLQERHGHAESFRRPPRQLVVDDDATCTWEMMIASQCKIFEYCSANIKLGEDTQGYSCYGNQNYSWYISFINNGLCYEDAATDEKGIFLQNNPTLTDNGYCSNRTEFYNFTKDTLISYDYQEIVTHPTEKTGTLRIVHQVEKCDASSADINNFGASYCQLPCPETVEIDGMQCNDQCDACGDDGSEAIKAINCDNIDPSLVQGCNANKEKDFLIAVLNYFEGNTQSPTMSPPIGDNTEDDTEDNTTTPAPDNEMVPPTTSPVVPNATDPPSAVVGLRAVTFGSVVIAGMVTTMLV